MYENIRNLSETPHNRYINQLQALINDRWDNSTQTSYPIYQQAEIGSATYEVVDVSVDTAIDIGTGFKKGDDFKVFSHKDISTEVPLGLMYKTDRDYWICINTNGFESPTNSIEVRRCNNIMKWVNPQNGCVYEHWCAIDYELSSPQPSKDKDVVVASGHVFVIVQGNSETWSIRKNQRFIFNGQPYKVGAYQTMLDNSVNESYSTLLYIDMYLDTIQPTDDLVNGIANATDYTYTIEIQPDVTEQVDGFIGQMSATIELNGEVVDRDVVWSGNEYVEIDASGNYTLSGEVGDIAIITTTLSGNSDVIATCNVEIVESIEDNYEIVIDPSFDEVRQKQPMTFTAYLYQNGVRQDSEITCEYSGLTTDYFALSQDGHTFILSVLKLTNDPLTLTFSSGVTTKTIIVALKPLF